MTMTLTFDAVNEADPGPKWAARWERSWPAYRAWFLGRGGDRGPERTECREALGRYMPELLPVYDRLTLLAGNSDLTARFLSTWCPPPYLGGCSLAAAADGEHVRLVRNYDLSPDLNEGLLLRTEWTGRAVMGMVEFLWGLSDGINDAGLSVALAYGGRSESGRGFGITTILRYVLETCDTVPEALDVFRRVPSHMAYNLVLADRADRTASVELSPGGGVTVMPTPIATNHQSGNTVADRPGFTRSFERHAHLEAMDRAPLALGQAFTRKPLRQDRYAEGFGTLFTAEYDCVGGGMELTWPDDVWVNRLDGFAEGRKVISYEPAGMAEWEHASHDCDWSAAGSIDWFAVARDFMNGRGRSIQSYLPPVSGSQCGENHPCSGRQERRDRCRFEEIPEPMRGWVCCLTIGRRGFLMKIELTVNGTARALDLDPRVTLLDALREHLKLTGSKKGCDHGQCGACTVIAGGRRINSCLSLAVMHDGDEITTVEGLADATGGALQQAFVKHDGMQCGYCTPGQLCSATAMLDELKRGWPSHVSDDLDGPYELTHEELSERMSGNLCRCSCYPGINAAITETGVAK